MNAYDELQYKALFKCDKCKQDLGDPVPRCYQQKFIEGYLVVKTHGYAYDKSDTYPRSETPIHTYDYELYEPEGSWNGHHHSTRILQDDSKWGRVGSRSISTNDRFMNSKPAVQNSLREAFAHTMDEDVIPTLRPLIRKAFPEIDRYMRANHIIKENRLTTRVHLFDEPVQLDFFRMPRNLSLKEQQEWYKTHQGYFSGTY